MRKFHDKCAFSHHCVSLKRVQYNILMIINQTNRFDDVSDIENRLVPVNIGLRDESDLKKS